MFNFFFFVDGNSKSEQTRKKFVTLANGQQVCISNCRRQHRTSVTSHLSHFEPMPTIHEEDDLDVGSFTKSFFFGFTYFTGFQTPIKCGKKFLNITKFFVHNFTSPFSVVIVYKAFLIVF